MPNILYKKIKHKLQICCQSIDARYQCSIVIDEMNLFFEPTLVLKLQPQPLSISHKYLWTINHQLQFLKWLEKIKVISTKKKLRNTVSSIAKARCVSTVYSIQTKIYEHLLP